ncbi:hypothetical protein [Paraburkholderia sp.]|uniref:hypothetical protein n=1 Tax=Paraburkholderia sp. TaxID=1926495 RepID=UPI0025F32B97|nr:hypothetical protein [Paraburkholderia sp.]
MNAAQLSKPDQSGQPGSAWLSLLALAMGAAAGGAAISAGFSYAAVPIVGALIAASGLALVFLQIALQRRYPQRNSARDLPPVNI